jgi:hypothetical protein
LRVGQWPLVLEALGTLECHKELWNVRGKKKIKPKYTILQVKMFIIASFGIKM